MVKIASDSYDLPTTKLCVSHWLEQKTGGVYIGNAVNTDTFNPKNAFGGKQVDSLLYFYRGIPWKQDDLAFTCLSKLYEKKKIRIHWVTQQNLAENLHLNIPFELHIDPPDVELAKLYSTCRVLLYTSLFEGFGLPPLEALACGTNVVSTPFEGNEFLFDQENCSLASSQDGLVSAALELLGNDALAQKQIANGKKTVAEHHFDRMIDRLENALKHKVS
jgi:glycosyltransferase involved in cell wall biosynthesis